MDASAFTGSISGPVSGSASSQFKVNVGSGNLTVGSVTASGNIALTAPAGNITVNAGATVDSTGTNNTLSMSTLASGTITLGSGALTRGDFVALTTHQLTNSGTVQARAQSMTLTSNSEDARVMAEQKF